MSKPTLNPRLAAAFALTLAVPSGARAQTADSSASAATAQESAIALQEVIVTARKRNERMQDVAISMSEST
jgi:hypothetical protein